MIEIEYLIVNLANVNSKYINPLWRDFFMDNGNGNPFATGVGPNSQTTNTLEQNQQILENLANVCKTEFRQQDIHLAERLIEIGGVYAKLKTEERNFKLFLDIPEFTHTNLDAAIALSKIKDISQIYNFGWKKLYYLYINSTGIHYSKISLDDVKKDFGDISQESVEKAFIKIVIRSSKLDVQKINDYWSKGLRLEMLRDKRNIKKIQETKNISQTIKGIVNKYEVRKLPDLKDYFEPVFKNIMNGIKAKKMINKTGKYDNCINIETILQDFDCTSELFTRILPIYEEDVESLDEFLTAYLNEI